MGTYEQNILVVWKLGANPKDANYARECRAVASVLIDDFEEGEQTSTNAIIVNANQPRKMKSFPDLDEDHTPYYFYTIGSNSTITCWMFAEYGDDQHELTCAKIPKPEGLPSLNFLSGAYFSHLNPVAENANSFCSEEHMVGGLLIGCQDGSILYYDHDEGYIDLAEQGQNNKVSKLLDEQIGHVSIRKPQQEQQKQKNDKDQVVENSVVLMGSAGSVVRYTFKINKQGTSYPIPDVNETFEKTQAEGAITAVQMDANNHEGIFGTSLGNIFYTDLREPN